MKNKLWFLVLFVGLVLQSELASAQNAEIEQVKTVNNVCIGGNTGEWHLDSLNFSGDLECQFKNAAGIVLASDTLAVGELSTGSFTFWAIDTNYPLDTLRLSTEILEPEHSAMLSTEEIRLPECFGDNDGYIRLSDQYFQGNLWIEWSNGDDSLIADTLNSAWYRYTAVDQACPNDTIRQEIFMPEPERLRYEIIQLDEPHCYDGLDGFAVIDVKGGWGHNYLTSRTEADSVIALGDERFALYGLHAGYNYLELDDANCCKRDDSIYVEQPFDGPLSGELEVRHESCVGCNDGGIRLASTENTYDVVKLYYEGYHENPYEEWIEFLAPGDYSVELKSIHANGYCVITLQTIVEPFVEKYQFETPNGFIVGEEFDIYTINGLGISDIPEFWDYELSIVRVLDNYKTTPVVFKNSDEPNILPYQLDVDPGAYIWVFKLNGQIFKGVINVFNN